MLSPADPGMQTKNKIAPVDIKLIAIAQGSPAEKTLSKIRFVVITKIAKGSETCAEILKSRARRTISERASGTVTTDTPNQIGFKSPPVSALPTSCFVVRTIAATGMARNCKLATQR